MATSRTSIRVVLADDHEVTRQGIRTLLQAAPDIELVGAAADGWEAQALVTRLQPHVLLLDLIMPGVSPVEMVLWAAREHPETAVLVLTGHRRNYYLAQMLQAGVVGFVDKNERAAELLAAIRRAAQGQLVFTQTQQRCAKQWRAEVQAPWKSLTAREQEVLRWLGAGLSNREIGKRLHIAAKTVSKYVSAVFTTIGVTSRTQAALWWWRSGLEGG